MYSFSYFALGMFVETGGFPTEVEVLPGRDQLLGEDYLTTVSKQFKTTKCNVENKLILFKKLDL